jgi:hypothetical protein
MAVTTITQNQTAEKSILDVFYRQTYLGNSYIVPIASLALGSTSETPLLLIQNPAVSTASSAQKAIFVSLRRFASDDQQVLIKTYVNPTITGTSTATTPVNLRPASANTSLSKCYGNGQFTSSANGTLISSIGCAADDYVVMDNKLLVILDPGQSMLLTATALVESTNVNADISWYEL